MGLPVLGLALLAAVGHLLTASTVHQWIVGSRTDFTELTGVHLYSSYNSLKHSKLLDFIRNMNDLNYPIFFILEKQINWNHYHC